MYTMSEIVVRYTSYKWRWFLIANWCDSLLKIPRLGERALGYYGVPVTTCYSGSTVA